METIYAKVKKCAYGFMGVYGSEGEGSWSISCGIIRIDKSGALADAIFEINSIIQQSSGVAFTPVRTRSPYFLRWKAELQNA